MSDGSSPSKVLIFGEISSKASLNEAIVKANQLHNGKNGPFGLFAFFAQSLASVFGDDASNDPSSYDMSEITSPDLPAYLLVNTVNPDGPKYGKAKQKDEGSGEQDDTKEEDDGDDDVTILMDGKLTLLKSAYGKLNTRTGISLAWFGSTGSIHNADDRSTVYSAVEYFKKSAPVDILLTRLCPNWITRGTALGNENNLKDSEETIVLKNHINRCQDTTLVARAALPRYMFVSYSRDLYRRPRNEGEAERHTLFWERLPYYTALPNPAGEQEVQEESDKKYTLSRFISLAPFGLPATEEIGKKLVRYHYLFALRSPRPAAGTIQSITPNGNLSASTPTPFFEDKRKRKRHDQGDYADNGKHRNKRRHTTVIVEPENCFLCLSSSTLANHMIAAIADDAYVTLARGPLFQLGGRHLMIVPIAHVPTLGAQEHDDRTKVIKERQKYMEGLCEMYFSEEPNPFKSQLVVTFEISRARNVHCHTQVVAFPEGTCDGLVDAFKDATEKFGYPEFEENDEDNDNYDTDLLKICVYAKPNAKSPEKVLTLDLGDNLRFNLQFPRKVLAEYAAQQPGFDGQDRSVWTEWAESKQDETKHTEQLKNAFSTFDFSS